MNPVTNSNRRFQKRSLCADLVKLEWNDPESNAPEPGAKQTIPAVLEDISPRGACLQVESPIPVSMEAEIVHEEDWVVRGRTTYCIFREIGYFVGIEFEDDAEWSKKVFSPEHLLDLEELTAEKP